MPGVRMGCPSWRNKDTHGQICNHLFVALPGHIVQAEPLCFTLCSAGTASSTVAVLTSVPVSLSCTLLTHGSGNGAKELLFRFRSPRLSPRHLQSPPETPHRGIATRLGLVSAIRAATLPQWSNRLRQSAVESSRSSKYDHNFSIPAGKIQTRGRTTSEADGTSASGNTWLRFAALAVLRSSSPAWASRNGSPSFASLMSFFRTESRRSRGHPSKREASCWSPLAKAKTARTASIES